MREIKFRAWDGQKIITAIHIFVNGPGIFFENLRDGLEGTDNLVYTKDFTIMQYTGLLDKNGKEIYEGDIIKIHSFEEEDLCNMVVSFCRGQFTLQNLYEGGTIEDEHYQIFPQNNPHGLVNMDGTMEDYEVIGNLYKNPELLK